MKVVLQRVQSASVSVDNKVIGSIGRGYLILLGIGANDTKHHAEKMAEKIKKLRIFPDENGKINLSIDDVQGEILVISQFTLYADCQKGNRPSFTNAASPSYAEELYEYFVRICTPLFKRVAHGRFGADMKVELVNDGPFTIILEIE